jgi:hypothetical protein
MEKKISINQLASSLITRSRGLEAYHALCRYINAGRIELDLNTGDLISLSFLDEIILRLRAGDQLDRIIFLIGNLSVHEKLRQIASVRRVSFLVRTQGGAAAVLIEPKAPDALVVKGSQSEQRT